jgi:hypothetical protein
VAQLSDVVKSLYIYAATAPEALLIAAYRQAARKFFSETFAWKADVVLADGATPAEYVITPPTGAEVFDFSRCGYGTAIEGLEKRTFEQMASENPSGARRDPCSARIGGVNQLLISPAPAASVLSKLALRGICRPTRTAPEIPDDLVAKYHDDCIELGAMEIVTRVPAQPWSDIKMSAAYRASFQEKIDEHRSKAADDGMVGVARTVRYGGL